MPIASLLFSKGESLRELSSGAAVLDALEDVFRSFGATHFLATGLPLPGRPIDTLVVRCRWPSPSGERTDGQIGADDPLLQLALEARHPLVWYDDAAQAATTASPLLRDLGAGARMIIVPICTFSPYQGTVIAGGKEMTMEKKARLAIDHVCTAAFDRLFELHYLRPERPGDLSARERRVVELSANGKTANQIATILQISQRTVHAHLQNASEKLRARNKTHTVVEALRYGQITV